MAFEEDKLRSASELLAILIGGTYPSGTPIPSAREQLTTSTDPALNAAVATAIVDVYDGVIITTTAAANNQTVQDPTAVTSGKKFRIVNSSTSSDPVDVIVGADTITLAVGESTLALWDGAAWSPTEDYEAADQVFFDNSTTGYSATDVQAAIDEMFTTGAATFVVADESVDTTCFPVFVTAATGALAPKSASGLTFNSATDTLSATAFSGPLTGNVTGNCSGTADTVTNSTQAAITTAANLTTVGTITSGVWNAGAVTSSGAFAGTSLNLTADSNQIVLDSDDGSGFTTTITDSASAARVVTLPDATDTLVGKATTDTLTNKTFDANGTGNSLSNVDVADLANGTDGELITWDAAGAPATVAAGTATHVLTSNGAGAAPTFQAPGGGGAFTTATNVTSNSPGTLGTDDFVFGSDSLDDDGDTTHDSRVFFDKSKSTFFAGRTLNTVMDDANRGSWSAAFGNQPRVDGTASFCAGNSCIASGDYSVAFGSSTQATATNAVAFGANGTSVAVSAFTIGERGNGHLDSQFVQASGRFSNNGDAQYSRVVTYADTTNDTPEEMYIGNTTSSKVVIPADTAWTYVGYVTARDDADNAAGYKVEGVIKRDGANNTADVGTPTVTTLGEDAALTSASVSVAANDTDETLAVTVTGIAATNIRWVCSLHLTEVNY